MGKLVKYTGTTEGTKDRDAVSVDGVVLELDKPVEVDDDLAKELLAGSDRLEGYEFAEAKGEPAPADPDKDKATPPPSR